MKVMGSAILFFEAIVLGLSIPISIVVYDVDKSITLWVTFLLMLLCILAIGGVRHDRGNSGRRGLVAARTADRLRALAGPGLGVLEHEEGRGVLG